MSATEFALVLGLFLCVVAFTALIVVLFRVLQSLKELRRELRIWSERTEPLLSEIRESTLDARDAVEDARRDLDRFDRVLGSAEAISGAVSGTGRLTRTALSTPVIKTAAIATGTSRAVRRLSRRERRARREAGTNVTQIRRRKSS
ncbi:MAG: hypothetical protein RLZ86_303 [Actinomycetota bacterium]|jgi:hypothetical protein